MLSLCDCTKLDAEKKQLLQRQALFELVSRYADEVNELRFSKAFVFEDVVDNADLKEVYDTERHLLYVACTRARDRLLVTSGEVPSEFLEDLVIG